MRSKRHSRPLQVETGDGYHYYIVVATRKFQNLEALKINTLPSCAGSYYLSYDNEGVCLCTL